MKRRGVTLIEMMVAAVVGLLVALATGYAYQSAVTTQSRVIAKAAEVSRQSALERRLRVLLQTAVLPTTAGSPTAYYIYNNLTGSSSGTTRLVFLSAWERVRDDALNSDLAFEDHYAEYGPQGGYAEVEIGTEAIGSGGTPRGLLLRVQRPADGDPTQGGEQEVLFEEVESIEFEFFDGASWTSEWDTQTQDPPRLPAAVRARYRLTDDDRERVLTVRVPASDVTIDNPLTVGGTAP
jgi:prepilin-type N-terminal cleavage/methylation domain-containing protein